MSSVRTWCDGVWLDCRQACRSLTSTKTFTVASSLTFALGIGVNIAVFSVVDRLLFRPFPYANGDRLVQLHLFATRLDDPITAALMPYEISAAIQQEASSFEGLALEGGWVDATVPAPGENPLLLTPVSANSLDVLGVRPVLGRTFEAGDEAPGSEIAVLLSYEAWQTRFGGTADVLSHTWGGSRSRHRIVGVLPPTFFFPSSRFVERVDGLSVLKPGWVSGRLTVAPVARLRPGVSPQAAQAEVDLLVRRHSWVNASLRRNAATGRSLVTVQPLRDGLSMIVGPYLWLTSSAVWIVLGVACINLSTLLLMRGQWQQHAAAVRAALGASPARLIRLGLLEAVMLCLVGGCIGWLVCIWMEQWIVATVPPIMRGLAVTPSDSRILMTTSAAATVSALAAAAAPALALRRLDLISLLRGELAVRRGRSLLRGGGILLCLEAAFGVLVAVGAAIMVPNLVRFLLEPTGFRDRDLFIVTVNHDWTRSASSQELRAERLRTILDVLTALPHVERVSAALTPPFMDVPATSEFWKRHGIAGRQYAVGPDIFQTLQVPLRAGREFLPDDPAGSVAILNETGARALWPGEPLGSVPGRRIETAGGGRMIVGVARDIRNRPAAPVAPDLFLPIMASEVEPRQTGLPVIARMAPGAIPDVALITSRLNERFPPNRARVVSVADQLAPLLDRPRFLAVLFGGVASIALLLVGVGVYAVASVECARRRREMAIRQALGASPAQTRRLILLQVVSPVVAGTAIGLATATMGIESLQPHVAELTMTAPAAYLAAALVMIGTTTAAGLWSTLRVAHAEPGSVLR